MSFASPPVDQTITAVSYPSSPESTRSPPWQWTQPATPNYRTAFLRDPFEDLSRNTGEDEKIQEALQNAQSNTDIAQTGTVQSQEDAVKQTLGRFAPARRPSSTPDQTASTTRVAGSSRHSLDVEAFTRLLLTGDSTKNEPSLKHSASVSGDNASSTDTNSVSQSSLFEVPAQTAEITPRSSQDYERATQPSTGDTAAKAPPPAPAPRRGKSVKVKDQPQNLSGSSAEPTHQPSRTAAAAPPPPPPPPTARRSSQHVVASSKEDKVEKQTESDTQMDMTAPTIKTIPAPPPPPIRRQHSISGSRRSSDLAPTAEEPDQSQLLKSSRHFSMDRPPAPPSRNSSASIKRQSLSTVHPPPVPPTRRGRDSSRSSMDSFRPSLTSIMGGDGDHENSVAEQGSSASDSKETRNLTPSSADSILAELANLQKELDAARRNA